MRTLEPVGLKIAVHSPTSSPSRFMSAPPELRGIYGRIGLNKVSQHCIVIFYAPVGHAHNAGDRSLPESERIADGQDPFSYFRDRNLRV